MGEVIGLTTSQTAASVLAAAGITRSYNTARFLGHLTGRREALGAMPVPRGSLLIVDEASMVSLADLASILAIARRTSSKVMVTGDHEQLAAVEGGGAMLLLAHRLGYVQLAEPQRFAHPWERDATLRLRVGDVTVLAEYAEHGRLRGGTAEDAAEQAYRGWLADYLAGLDSVLIARTEDQARELSRRARDDLVRYGRVAPGPQVRLAAGEHASAGDLITARRNDRSVLAGLDGRELANRDILRLTATMAGPRGDRVEVRRLLGRDPDGQTRWSEPFCLARRYLASHATLGYATTAHAALGRTTDTAHALVDGLAGRQALYVAMSRGRFANYAYCLTQSPRLADIAEGSQRAPELDRAARLDRERAGLPSGFDAQGVGTVDAAVTLDPVTVLAGILARDSGELSATETLEEALARADHLGVLGGIWDDLVRQDQRARFEQALRAALPAELADEALGDPARVWLWRSLREAESAGLDGGHVLRQAIEARSMTGARDVARVLDSRVRRLLDGMRPWPPGLWADRVPDAGSAEIKRYLHELAEAMDDRARRLGEHAAQTELLWARQALGPIPAVGSAAAKPAARLEWEHRASVIAAYRERYGYDDAADPIGPEPTRNTPEARAAWHGALAALGRIDGIDLRHCTDGELWLRRGTYERETAWAPPHIAAELQLVRTAGRDAHVNAIRAEHEARATRHHQAAARHYELARRWRAIEAKASAEERILADAQATRGQWGRVTESTQRIAIAADIELRRRHPDRPIPALRPHQAEAAVVTWPEPSGRPDQRDQLALSGRTARRDRRARDLVPAAHPEVGRVAALGLTLETADVEIPAELRRISKDAANTQAQLAELVDLRLPADERDGLSPGLAWPEQSRRSEKPSSSHLTVRSPLPPKSWSATKSGASEQVMRSQNERPSK